MSSEALRCKKCNQAILTIEELLSHYSLCVDKPSINKQVKCHQCDKIFEEINQLMEHRENCYPHGIPFIRDYINDNLRRYTAQSAFRGAARYIRFEPINPPILPLDFFSIIQPQIEEVLTTLLNGCQECKVQAVLQLRIHQVDPATGEITRREDIYFSTYADHVSNEHFIDNMQSDLLRKIDIFIQNGSNWIVVTVIFFDLRITKYFSIPYRRGNCYTPSPLQLKRKRAVVNVNNGNANNCFLYAVLSILHYNDITRDRHRSSKYSQWIDELNFGDLSFPIRARDIPKFEKLNPGLYINLLEWSNDNENHPLRSLRCCGYPKQCNDMEPKVINILTFQAKDRPPHYVGVTNLNALLNGKSQTHRGFKHCERCLQPFQTERLLQKHREYCYTGRPETLVPCEEKQFHIFQNWQATQRLPYIIYADIECFLEDTGNTYGHVKLHKAAAIAYLLISHPEMKMKPLEMKYEVFQGDDCILQCMMSLEETARQVYNWNKTYTLRKANMSGREYYQHVKATTCYMCSRQFNNANWKTSKVIEHDHITGEYRGAACQECNGKKRLRSNYLPIFFHNFRNYDCHVLCAEALGKLSNWKLSVIAQTKEKYMAMNASFEIEKVTDKKRGIHMTLAFRDSYQFLNASLDKLVRNLSLDELVYTKKAFSNETVFEALAHQKGVFPYSYLNSKERLDERQLPPKEHFFDDLNQTDCSDADYERAQKTWRILECETFNDYMLAYLKTDVFQLADVFETFRNLTLKQDELDPAYYLTIPGLAWDSAFKMTGAIVDLVKDVDTYCFIEEGIRGGMTFVNKHHITSNTPRLPETYDPTKDEVDLLYIDANNLYGNALSQKLPQSNFVWLSKEEIDKLDIVNFDYSNNIGHLLKVDLEYPPELQDTTVDLPFAPEKCILPETCLTDFMQSQWKDLWNDSDRKYRGYSKLLLTHWNKKDYVIHGELLQYFLRKGMLLRKIHRCLQFHQSAFFEPYITFNSIERQQATSSFEKDYYKLRNNSLFGKTMENVRKRMKFRLCSNEESLTTYASRPEFLSSTIFNENLAGIQLAKDKVVFDKPIFIGQAVLDISKLIMYKLVYDTLCRYEQEIGGKIEIVGGDTDSLFLKTTNMRVETHLIPQMCQEKLLDTSNYPPNHAYFSNECKAKLGCIKDEAAGKPFVEWILLRPKCYSMLTGDGKEIKRAKGVRLATIFNEITHKMYRGSYKKQKRHQHVQRRIGSNHHQMYNITYKKRTLSFFEDKRAWISKNHSLPFGNYRLGPVEKPIRKRAHVLPVLLEPQAKVPRLK